MSPCDNLLGDSPGHSSRKQLPTRSELFSPEPRAGSPESQSLRAGRSSRLPGIGGASRGPAPGPASRCRGSAAGSSEAATPPRRAPPRARIGGLCLPLNSRKPPARVPAGEALGGARGLPAGRGPSRASVSRPGQGEGGRTAAVGSLPRARAALGLPHVETPRAAGGEGLRPREWARSRDPSPPSGLSLHLRRVGASAVCLGLGRSQRAKGSPGSRGLRGPEAWPGSLWLPGRWGFVVLGFVRGWFTRQQPAQPGGSEPRSLPGRLTQVSFPLFLAGGGRESKA